MVVAALAGVVQGVVEWLPVSSKTMITLIFAAGGYSFGTAYVMGLLANFGSFFAALWFFRRDIASALAGLRHPFADEPGARKLRYLVLATVATGVVGLPIYVLVKHAFSAATGTAAMIGIGVLLLATGLINSRRERLARSGAGGSRGVPGTAASLVVGACQGLAALPGISRSAVTVTPLLLWGHDADEALRFSFLLDVLGLLGAGVAPLAVGHGGLRAIGQVGAGPVAVLLIVSAVVSVLAIGGILRLASRLRSSTIATAIGALTIIAALVSGIR